MISQSRYVNIISGVGAGANVAQKDLGMRVITQNTAIPPGIVAEFSGQSMADNVGAYFGAGSEEYKRAAAYQGFISKQINAPNKISFARWVNSDIAPTVVGDTSTKDLAALKAIAAGTLTIMSGGVAVQIAAIDLTTATSLTQVAALVQAAIRTSADTQLTAAVVTYNTNTAQFVLTGTVTGAGTLSVALGGNPPLASDIAGLLGWGTTGTVNVPGQTADTALQAIQKTTQVSNNFGSFVFATPAVPFTTDDIAAVAAWNDTQNNQYLYSVAVKQADAGALYAAVKGYSGCALNLLSSTLTNDFIEQSPCEILAATNYSQTNATQNYMFYQFPSRNITVSDDATADSMDALRVNYIGVTQTNGQQLAFYQQGVLCGGANDAVDMNTYANEMWLKSAITAAIMSFFLAVGRVPANEIGQGQTLAILQGPIDQAKTNGTISAGKQLSTQQQLFITSQSGDPNAWRQVQTIGYWVTVNFSSYVDANSGLTKWKATYSLIYSKDDAIRMVTGQDILI